jgi:Uri superfamily endonuclease
MVDIPALPGSYYLHLVLTESIELQIGRLGLFHLEPGSYFYCGSALGPGGLRARINHHLAGSGKSHWHIDYLRRSSQYDHGGVLCWSRSFGMRLESGFGQSIICTDRRSRLWGK